MPRTPAHQYRPRLAAGSLSVLCLGLALGSGSPAAHAQRASPSQARLWKARYQGPGKGFGYASALGVSPDGATVFVTGSSPGSGGVNDYATVAYDAATGAQLWVSRYNGPGNNVDSASALGVSSDGATVYVTGGRFGSSGDSDYATLAYDATTGAQRWVSRYNGLDNGYDSAAALGLSPDGDTVYVTGGSNTKGGGADYATLAYDATTGAQRWVSRYEGPGNGYNSPTALGVGPDGGSVIVTGSSLDGFFDYATVAYDSTSGAQRWVSRYDGQGHLDDYAHALGLSADGGTVIVTGNSCCSGGSHDYATVAYDAATGTQRWEGRYDGPGDSADVATALGVSPDGATVLVTGGSPSLGGLNDYATVAYDVATGSELWVARYNGQGNGTDSAAALGVTPDGATVFVTGTSEGSGGVYDYATVAYDTATGQLLAAGSIGPGSSFALGVSPDGGSLFVTGSGGISNDAYYGTVAYTPIP